MVFVSDVCVEYINFIYYESKLSVTPKRLKPVKSRINNLSFAPAFFVCVCFFFNSLFGHSFTEHILTECSQRARVTAVNKRYKNLCSHGAYNLMEETQR